MRWQQLSGPMMAKGNEDTALYRFFPLASRNEVGGHPAEAPASVDETHDQLDLMADRWPHSMIATSTHDTKRSEDVRARIDVLSELPNEWSERFAAWQRFNRDQREIRNGRVIPNDNLEYFIYQTLIGAWPLDQNEVDQFRGRLHEYVIKAVREAKEHSSWGEPDAVYEDALMSFLDSLFNSDRSGAFLADFTAFQGYVARVGALNSLSQTLIKLTSPGVPDIYQGSELWDLSLVDPDNRRPVDYQRRQQELAGFDRAASRGELLDELMANWSDGRIKLFLIQSCLKLRERSPAVFRDGSYTAIRARGKHVERLFSYVRTYQNDSVLVVAPRLCTAIIDDGAALSATRSWGDTNLPLPAGWAGKATDLFSGEQIPIVNVQGAPSLLVSDVMRHFPVGLVWNERPTNPDRTE
jgi:(1->4)-alpha-D-glucan 1-alpha-D-glucosylmutase